MVETRTVAALVRRFQDSADGSGMKSRELILMLLDHSPAPFSRNQFTPGHITCTGLVLSPRGDAILLVHHSRLDRWLLPGGHVEPDDPEIWDGARREVVEETGALLEPGAAPLAGLDVHGIPGKGSEPYHLHHDLVFQFRAVAAEIRLSHESRAVAWCTPAEFGRYAVPANVSVAWQRAAR